MKTKPVPTSPKVRKKEEIVEEIYRQDVNKSFDKPLVRSRNGILILIIATLAGFLAGILGETIINALAVSYPNLPVVNSLYVSTYPVGNNIIIQQDNKTLEAQEFEILETLDNLQSAVLTVFEKKDSVINSVLGESYQSGEAVGNAIVLTDDGLLVTTNQVLPDLEKEYVVITSDKKIYLAEEMEQDVVTDLVFFRIGASNLSVAEFIDPTELHVGQKLFTLANKTNGSYQTDSSAIRDLLYYQDDEIDEIVYSSEKLTDLILINNSLDSVFLGSPLVTANGKVVGIALKNELDEIDLVFPAEYIQQTISKILQDNTISRTFFGVTYIDLSRITQLESELFENNSVGALIYDNNYDNRLLYIPAVQQESPAENIGLEVNDIILSISGKEISINNSLSEIIQSFEPGEKVDVEYLHDGEKMTGQILLTEFE